VSRDWLITTLCFVGSFDELAVLEYRAGTDQRQAAMRGRAEEQKAAAGRGAGAKVDCESDAPRNLTSDDESWIVALIKKAAR